MPPPPLLGLLPLLLPRVASSRRCSAPQTLPQLEPAPPPHFLKYATCVLAPPTPRTSPLPEQPDTGPGFGSAHAPSSAPLLCPDSAGCGWSGLPAGGRRVRGARAQVPGGLQGAPACLLGTGDSAATALPRPSSRRLA
jgi:hypothetical protein